MAQVISIMNNKGGCGKTTTAVNLGAALRRSGYDVLLIDFDGQTNLTTSLRVDVSKGTSYDAMRKETPQYITPSEVIAKDDKGGFLDVLPSAVSLSALDVLLAEKGGKAERVQRLKRVIDSCYRDKYDYIIIDTPPAINLLTTNALYASDCAIATVQPEFLAVQGLVRLYEAVREVETATGEGRKFAVLFTLFDKRKSLHKMIAENVEGSGVAVFDTRIRNNVALGEAPAAGLDIFRYAPNSNGAQDYTALAEEFTAWNKVRHIKHKRK